MVSSKRTRLIHQVKFRGKVVQSIPATATAYKVASLIAGSIPISIAKVVFPRRARRLYRLYIGGRTNGSIEPVIKVLHLFHTRNEALYYVYSIVNSQDITNPGKEQGRLPDLSPKIKRPGKYWKL